MVVVDAPPDGDPRAWIGQLGGPGKADAVVALLGDHVPDAVEMRIVDARTGRLIARHMPFPSSEAATAKLLAIHTLELVRATFLEMDLLPAPRPPPVPAPLGRAATSAPRRPERISVAKAQWAHAP